MASTIERYIHINKAHLVEYHHERLQPLITERTLCGRYLNLRLSGLGDTYFESCEACYARTEVVMVPERRVRRPKKKVA